MRFLAEAAGGRVLLEAYRDQAVCLPAEAV